MSSELEILPAEVPAFDLPAGVKAPENLILNETEAARFLREPEARLRSRRCAGTGPAFIRPEGEPWAVRYFTWDLIRWAYGHRRTEMPRVSRRDLRRAAGADAA